jgi:hypothetical protein
MLPGKTFWVAIGLRDDGDENQALKFTFKALVYVMGFEQAVVWVGVEINGDGFLDGALQFLLQILYKVKYPAIQIIVVTVADKDVVFIA